VATDRLAIQLLGDFRVSVGPRTFAEREWTLRKAKSLAKLPQIMTLKPAAGGMTVTVAGGAVVVQQGSAQQYSFLARALYYVFVGWWLSGLWLLTAWSLLAMTMGLALPLSFWMFNRAPAVTTLARL
jgi:hypothetical protein